MPNQSYDEQPIKHATFWQAIREIRKERGLTQSHVADLLSESADAAWISRIEHGKKNISLRMAIRIVEALGAQLQIGNYIIESDER